MSEKRPQPTTVLIERLQRVARKIDRYAEDSVDDSVSWKARANTCWQVVARLDEQQATIFELLSVLTEIAAQTHETFTARAAKAAIEKVQS